MNVIKKNYLIVIGIVIVYLFLIYSNTQLFFISLFLIVSLTLLTFKTNLFILAALFNFNKGNVNKGEMIFKKLIDKNTKNYKPYMYIGNNELHAGNYDKAIELLKKALTLNPDIIGHKNTVCTLSCCYWKKKDVATAIKYLEDLRNQYEYINDGILATLGFYYILEDNLDSALKITELALLVNESNSQCYDNLGQIYTLNNQHDKAYEAFNKALELKPDSVDALFNLGFLYEKDGHLHKALKYYNLAKEAPPTTLNDVTIDQIINKIENI